jgi:hypothetical protein
MLRNIPEERRSHLHRGESLKSRTAACLKILTNINLQFFPEGFGKLQG